MAIAIAISTTRLLLHYDCYSLFLSFHFYLLLLLCSLTTTIIIIHIYVLVFVLHLLLLPPLIHMPVTRIPILIRIVIETKFVVLTIIGTVISTLILIVTMFCRFLCSVFLRISTTNIVSTI